MPDQQGNFKGIAVPRLPRDMEARRAVHDIRAHPERWEWDPKRDQYQSSQTGERFTAVELLTADREVGRGSLAAVSRVLVRDRQHD